MSRLFRNFFRKIALQLKCNFSNTSLNVALRKAQADMACCKPDTLNIKRFADYGKKQISPLIYALFFCLAIGSFYACNDSNTDSGERPEVGISQDSVVRRIAIPSILMGKVFNANVILPESYFLDSNLTFYPVVYLLHGHSGNYDNWYARVPRLREWANTYEMIIVNPDGNYNSWYLNSYQDSSSMFYSYISQEVPAYIDAHFRTYQDARYRAISGLSMGGHGALSIGLQHPDWFGIAGSMSGVVDLRKHTGQWEIDQHLGPYEADTLRWEAHSVVQLASQIREAPHLIIDCGTDDALLEENQALHQLLQERQVPHTYIERPGSHDWLYWEEAIEFQLLYFARLFAEG